VLQFHIHCAPGRASPSVGPRTFKHSKLAVGQSRASLWTTQRCSNKVRGQGRCCGGGRFRPDASGVSRRFLGLGDASGRRRSLSNYFCAEPSWSSRAPRARRPPREHSEWPSYGHYGRPTARRRHHGTRTSAHGHPRAVPSPGGVGSRRPRPRIRPPPKKNSKTLIAPSTPELTD
jgi:hypothetical protein